MGNQCATCDTTFLTGEIRPGDSKSNYAKFYAKAAGPLVQLDIKEFIFDLEQTRPLDFSDRKAFE